MRRLRVSMCEMKRSDIACWVWSRRAISSLRTSRMTLGVIAVALPILKGCPVRHPSPKKSPGPSIATTASRPFFESTDNFTPPDRMYITCPQDSPCVKIDSPRENSDTVLGTPDEARKVLTSKGIEGPAGAGFAGVRDDLRGIPQHGTPQSRRVCRSAHAR